MINAILNGIFNLIVSLVSLLLSPIDLLISQYLPGLNDAFNMISSFFNYVGSYIVWAVSWVPLNSNVKSLIVAYFTFQLTLPFLVSTIKLAIKWYDKLKP